MKACDVTPLYKSINSTYPSLQKEYKTIIDKTAIDKPIVNKSEYPSKTSTTLENLDFDVTTSFKDIVNNLTLMYEKKNHDYGNTFHDLYKECGFIYAYGHLKEKMNRISSLLTKKAEVNESMKDSIRDLANYAIMTLVELENSK